VQVVDLLVQVGDLELGLEIDVVFHVISHPITLGLPVLREQDEDREEDRLQRHCHGEQAERVGVEPAERVAASGFTLSEIQSAKPAMCR